MNSASSAMPSMMLSTSPIVESIIDGIADEAEFIKQCRKRSVFSDAKLREFWNYNKRYRPFIVNFLHVYSFPRRLNLEALIKLGVIANVESAPRGFEQITLEQFKTTIKASETNESFIIN